MQAFHWSIFSIECYNLSINTTTTSILLATMATALSMKACPGQGKLVKCFAEPKRTCSGWKSRNKVFSCYVRWKVHLNSNECKLNIDGIFFLQFPDAFSRNISVVLQYYEMLCIVNSNYYYNIHTKKRTPIKNQKSPNFFIAFRAAFFR